jgi:hypothetical protein
MVRLLAFSLFLSAALVFWVQPMFGKMVLPLLGGAPSVWNTCLVFFQAALLVGYLYAHAQTRLRFLRHRMLMHLTLLAAALVVLPVHVPSGWTPPTESNPIPWLLALLSISVGLPFVLVSASAPLLQNWFAESGRPGSRDPYFLYAASNAGSLVGLLGYPVLIEPRLTLSHQAWLWTGGYALLLLCFLATSAALWRSPRTIAASSEAGDADDRPQWRMRWTWVILAAVPSSLFQGVTTHITTDLAAVPLLWVLPLAVYLISFILVFARRPLLPQWLMINSLVVSLPLLILLVYWLRIWSLWIMLPANLIVLFFTAMVCHGELVRLRPPASRLTEFYLWMSVGGMLGGIFNALIAPVVFDRLVEYPLALVAAGLLVPARSDAARSRHIFVWDAAYPSLLLAVLAGGVWLAERQFSLAVNPWEYTMVGVVAAVIVASFRSRPVRYGLGLAALVIAGVYVGIAMNASDEKRLYVGRSFFGIVKVELGQSLNRVKLVHGNTVHGTQNRGPGLTRYPTAYFSRRGPLGNVFTCFPGPREGRRVGVVGLGAGTTACYARSGEHWVFYEIDPLVRDVARDTRLFTYLADCPAAVGIVMGDARLSLLREPDASFDLMILDAFSSDAIPLHLLTREAVDLYFRKLKPSGILAFHISNNYARLDGVLRNIALVQGLCGAAKNQSSTDIPPGDLRLGVNPSIWAVLARSESSLTCLENMPGWKRFSTTWPQEPVERAWTDDYSNIFQCLTLWSRGKSATHGKEPQQREGSD